MQSGSYKVPLVVCTDQNLKFLSYQQAFKQQMSHFAIFWNSCSVPCAVSPSLVALLPLTPEKYLCP